MKHAWWIAAAIGFVAGTVMTALYVPTFRIVVEQRDCIVVEREAEE